MPSSLSIVAASDSATYPSMSPKRHSRSPARRPSASVRVGFE